MTIKVAGFELEPYVVKYFSNDGEWVWLFFNTLEQTLETAKARSNFGAKAYKRIRKNNISCPYFELIK